MSQPTDPTPEVINIRSDDFPEAAALAGIIRGLYAARNGAPGVNPTALITEGARLIRESRPPNRLAWGAVAARAAQFWSAAATFQPRLARNEIAARKALSEGRFTIREEGGRGV